MADTTEDEVLEEKEEEVVEEEKIEEKEVPVRNTINAQRRIIEKLSKKDDKPSKDDEDDEELTPKARKLIQAEVDRQTATLKDELAFRDYFSEHPEDKKFQTEARKRFDAWGTVPIEEVMKTLRPTVSAEEKEKAIEKATKGSIRGGTVRPRDEQVATSEKDFQDIYKKVKRGETGDALRKLGIK